MKRYKIIFAVIWTASILLIVATQLLNARARADVAVEQAVTAAIARLDTYYIANNKMPASLNELDPEVKNANVNYTSTGTASYKLCAAYKNNKPDIDGNAGGKDVTLTETAAPANHPKGEVCYNYTEKDARLVNEAAATQLGANCSNLPQTSFQTESSKITKLDLETAMVVIGSKEYILCRDVEIREANGASSYTTDSFGKLRVGATVTLTGSDKDHIISVVIQ